MKKTYQFALIALMIMGTNIVNAQSKKDLNFWNKKFIPCSNINQVSNHNNSLSKKGVKVMLDSIALKQWDTTANDYSENTTSLKFYYDATGNATSRVILVYIASIGQTIAFQKANYTYNPNNKNTKILTQSNDGKNNWVYSNKTEFTYDSKGNNITEVASDWDDNSNSWLLNYSKTFTYNSNNKILVEIDSNDISTALTVQKIDYTYDANNNNTLKITTTWNNSTWVNTSKTEYTYDANNNNTIEINYNWNLSGNTWDSNDKTINTYDANGDQTLTTNLLWNTTTSAWDNNSKNTMNFNITTPYSDIYWPQADGFQMANIKHQLLKVVSQNYSNNAWVNSYNEDFFYKPFSASEGVLELNLNTANIYPNPTNGMVYINNTQAIETINVLDLNGKIVAKQNNGSKIDLSDLNNGVYFMNIQFVNGNISNKKLVISK